MMIQEATGLKIMVRWKLEKFDGEKTPGAVPVEVIEGGDEFTPEQYKEMQNGTNQCGS